MSDKPTIVQLDPKNDMKAGLEAFRRELDSMTEHARLVATVKRAYFEALRKEGFTDEQALELCTYSITL
jgi:hypothetical protein